ncbi:hypothetical protein FACS1894200_05130 [Spirochaetia bacterium]|nr:hypothetical protein FACS1894200_05130 [Spirochaetia bacterium]
MLYRQKFDTYIDPWDKRCASEAFKNCPRLTIVARKHLKDKVYKGKF